MSGNGEYNMGGGAWPFLVGGAICLVNFNNERNSSQLNRRNLWYLEGPRFRPAGFYHQRTNKYS